jgi:Cu+-exporting ATPase
MTLQTPLIEMISFPVEGMTCASCVNRITRYLKKVDGVENAAVNLATESATVRFDRARTDLPALVAAVEAAGYLARVDRIAAQEQATGDQGPTFAERHLVDIRRRLVVAGLLTTPILLGLAFGRDS